MLTNMEIAEIDTPALLVDLDVMERNLRNVAEEDVRVDMPVRVVFEPLTDEICLPQFEPDR